MDFSDILGSITSLGENMLSSPIGQELPSGDTAQMRPPPMSLGRSDQGWSTPSTEQQGAGGNGIFGSSSGLSSQVPMPPPRPLQASAPPPLPPQGGGGPPAGPNSFPSDPRFTGDPDSQFAGPPSPNMPPRALNAPPPLPMAPPPMLNGDATPSPGAPPVPMPMPRPPMAAPPMPPPQTVGPGGGAPMTTGAIPPAAPPMPGGAPGGFQPNFNTPIEPMRRPDAKQGGILSALGIDLSKERRGALAAGLSAAGANANKPWGAALAGSAGAAMEGGKKTEDQEDATQMKRNQQQFQQTSTAFGDALKAQATGNATKIADARAKLYDAQSKMASPEAKFWRNTPNGIAVTIEKQIHDATESERKTMETQWKLNGADKKQQDADKATLAAKMDEMRARLGQPHGLNPAQIQSLATMGQEPPFIKGPDGKTAPNPKFNPFDVRGMTTEQFKATIPMNSHYRDLDGSIKIRKYEESKEEDAKKKKPVAKSEVVGQMQRDDEQSDDAA